MFKVLLVSVILFMSLLVQAEGGLLCIRSQSVPGAISLAARAALVQELALNQALRVESRKAIEEIDKLEEKIRRLRLKNGNWEPSEITEKRLNVMALEAMVLMDDVRMLDAHFAGPFAATGRAAARYQSSEALIEFYNRKIKSRELEAAEGHRLIQAEEAALALAKEEFLGYVDKTVSLAYVLEVMKESGTILDVSTLFGGATRLADIHGKTVESKQEEPQYAALESTAMSRVARQQPKSEIQSKAEKLIENLNKFKKSQVIHELQARTQDIVGSGFQLNLSFQAISNLKKRLEPDWTSTDSTIVRRKATLNEQRLLRWKLRLMGPQLAEIITNWIGNVDGKYRQSLKPIADLVGLQYDRAVLRRHLPKILKVLSIKDPETQLQELLDHSGAGTYIRPGELIVTFIRFTKSRNDWNQIRAFLNASTAPLDKKIEAKFEEYEKEAMKRGPLPLISPEPDPTGTAIAVGMGTGVMWAASHGATWLTHTAGPYLQSLYSGENLQTLLQFLHMAAK